MRAVDFARHNLIASTLFLSGRISQLVMPLPLFQKEATNTKTISPLMLGWIRFDRAFYMLLYKVFTPNHLISCTSSYISWTHLAYRPGPIDLSQYTGNTLRYSCNCV